MPWALALAALLSGLSPPAARCEGLLGRAFAGGEVVSAAVVRDEPATPPFCRLELVSRPTPASRVGTELWLPLRGWSGRYVQLGAGGFAGAIPRAGLAAEVRRGSAAAATDTGHGAEDGFDARWALGHPERIVDYGHRSIKASADPAKATTAAFYRRRPRASYFLGCSNGGRQGLMAAQRYPELFDGVLAGAPALRWTEQLSAFARIQHALRAEPGAFIPPASLPRIQAAARQGRAPAGLNPAQARALEIIAAEFDPRWAAVPGGWDAFIVNPDRAARTQLTFAEQFFGNMVLGRPDWRVEDLTPADLAAARRLSPILDATGSLAAFRARGGKLILYTGSADPIIAPQSAVDYLRREGAPDFSRLYVAPGMLHCQGGAEPDSFGQSWVSPPLKADPAHDIRLALQAWVEEGRAPGPITAVKFADGDPGTAAAVRRLEPVR